MPKYMVKIVELDNSNVPFDAGSHSTVEYIPPTSSDDEVFHGLVVPVSDAALATLKASILTAIGVAETP